MSRVAGSAGFVHLRVHSAYSLLEGALPFKRLAELVFRYLIAETDVDEKSAAQAVWHDYQHGGRSDRPEFLRPYLTELELAPPRRSIPARTARQARHSS